jgi:hypothetical protein
MQSPYRKKRRKASEKAFEGRRSPAAGGITAPGGRGNAQA